jgi:hypothetical protein
MKAENIQSNASAPLLAGRAFGTFHSEQELTIVTRLLKDAKGLHTAQDLKDYCTGYKETLTGSSASKDSQTYMVRTILKVATGLDAKLCDYHKVKTPAAGQKVVQKQIDKGSKGLNSLSAALRIPSAGKAESKPEPEAETGYVTKADEWWDACIKLGHSEKYGLTTDEMMARIAEIVAK